MKYCWDELTKADYENIKIYPDEFVGKIRCGELCFDVLIRDNGEDGYSFSYDCYVANVDSGYGYTKDGIAYDYASGSDWYIFGLPYEDFVRESERVLDEFISWSDETPSGLFTIHRNPYSLRGKANAPLLIW